MSVRTNIYSLPTLIGLSISYEPQGPERTSSKVFFIYEERATASLEVIEGSSEEGIASFLYSDITAQVTELGGYIEPLDEDFPDELVVQFESDGKTHTEHHFFRYVNDKFVLDFTLLEQFYDDDIFLFRQYLADIEILDVFLAPHEFGETINIQFSEEYNFTRFGRRVYVEEPGTIISFG